MLKAQKRALSALWEAASSVLANEWYDKRKLDAVKVSPIQSDLRRVEYSADMAEIGFPSQGQDRSSTRDSTMDWQHQLDQLRSARGQSNLRLPNLNVKSEPSICVY